MFNNLNLVVAKRNFWMLLAAVLLSCVSLVCSHSPCIIYNNYGQPLDISPLTYNSRKASPPGYSMNTSEIEITYVNFCAPVSTSLGCSKDGDSGACQVYAGTPYNAGLVSEMKNASYSKLKKTSQIKHIKKESSNRMNRRSTDVPIW